MNYSKAWRTLKDKAEKHGLKITGMAEDIAVCYTDTRISLSRSQAVRSKAQGEEEGS